ncbi:hypothetical protein ACWEQ3_01520 [Streptomyces mirabilis]
MASLSPQRIPLAGLAGAYAAASAGGDNAPIGGRFFLEVRNGGASPVTVSIASPSTLDGLTIAGASLVVPANGSGMIPMGGVYRNRTTGRADITYSAVTSVSVAVFELP